MGPTCSKSPTTTQTTTTTKQVTKNNNKDNDNNNNNNNKSSNMAPIASTLALGAGYVIFFFVRTLFYLDIY